MDVDALFRAARGAQAAWRSRSVEERLAVVRALRHGLAARSLEVASRVPADRRAGVAETLTSELLPLLDACRFLERSARRVLQSRRLGRRGRPFWLTGVRAEVRREPHGVVLVIGPSNYPLMLPGIQALQAIVAGNAVVWKPAPGGEPVARLVADLFASAGLPAGLLTVTDASVETAASAISAGPDYVVLTGSYETGQAVLSRLSERAVPATVELSGCDAAFVLDDADVDLTVRALAFGLRLNGAATCIGPRRVFVDRRLAGVLEDRLAAALRNAAPMAIDDIARDRLDVLVKLARDTGARVVTGNSAPGGNQRPLLLADVAATMAIANSDLFAPVLSLIAVDGPDDALRESARSGYALGATVFGSPKSATALAERIDAGIVVVNDMIVPTADPRLPFGGRGKSGFGVTRGAEGLLELTRAKPIVVRAGKFRPHFDPLGPRAERWLPKLLCLAHGSWANRAALLRQLFRENTRNADLMTPPPATRRGDQT